MVSRALGCTILMLGLLACGGGGGSTSANSAAPSATSPIPPVMQTAIIERLDSLGHGTLCSVKEDGSAWKQISPTGMDVTYLSAVDGRILFQSKGTPAELYTMKPDGTGLVKVSQSLDAQIFRGLIGSRIIYSANLPAGSSIVPSLFAVNLDGTGANELGTHGAAKEFAAIAQGRVFYTLNASATVTDVQSVWPDDSHLGYVTYNSSGINAYAGCDATQVYYIQRSDSPSRPMGLYAHPIDAYFGSDRSLAPGKAIHQVVGVLNGYVVYSWMATDSGGASQKWIYAVTLDGSTTIGLAEGNGNSYEVEGMTEDRVIYQRPSTPGGSAFDIWSVHPNGTGALAIASSAKDERVSGIVGNRVFYSSRTPGSALMDLHVVTADGSGHAVLANDPESENLALVQNGIAIYSRAYDSNTLGLGMVGFDGAGVGAGMLTHAAGNTDFNPLFASGYLYFSRWAGPSATTYNVLRIRAQVGATPIPLSDGTARDKVVLVF